MSHFFSFYNRIWLKYAKSDFKEFGFKTFQWTCTVELFINISKKVGITDHELNQRWLETNSNEKWKTLIGNRRDTNVTPRTRRQQEGQFWFERSLNISNQQFRVSYYFSKSSIQSTYWRWQSDNYFYSAFLFFFFQSNMKDIECEGIASNLPKTLFRDQITLYFLHNYLDKLFLS